MTVRVGGCSEFAPLATASSSRIRSAPGLHCGVASLFRVLQQVQQQRSEVRPERVTAPGQRDPPMCTPVIAPLSCIHTRPVDLRAWCDWKSTGKVLLSGKLVLNGQRCYRTACNSFATRTCIHHARCRRMATPKSHRASCVATKTGKVSPNGRVAHLGLRTSQPRSTCRPFRMATVHRTRCPFIRPCRHIPALPSPCLFLPFVQGLWRQTS